MIWRLINAELISMNDTEWDLVATISVTMFEAQENGHGCSMLKSILSELVDG